jgi:hypothetical protein
MYFLDVVILSRVCRYHTVKNVIMNICCNEDEKVAGKLALLA